jgi:hypothetical protein
MQDVRGTRWEAGGRIQDVSIRSRFGVWDLAFVLGLSSFVVLLLWRALFAGQAFFWGTPLLQFVPWQRAVAETWRAGDLPLWNPLVGCGAPLAANYQTGAFYPLNALYLLLPAEVALSWITAVHLFLAGWGMYAWGRAVGLDRFPASIGGLALAGSGYLVARAALFPSVAFTFPWLAIWLWRTEELVQRRQLSAALWLGLSLGLGLLAGHAQTACYGGMLLAAYLVFRAGQEGGEQGARGKTQEAGGRRQEAGSHPKSAFHTLALFGLAALLGVALAAVQLLPTAELMLQSQRSAGFDVEFAMTYSLWPWRLITFAAPDFFGNPGRGDYWGYPNYWEGAGYVGLLPLMLAAWAVLGRKRGRGKEEAGQIWFWAASALVALVLALGRNTPVFPFLFRYVPGFNLFQAPARWLAVTTIALAALAALGAQRWPAGHVGQRLGSLGVVVGLALLLAGIAAPRAVPGIPTTFAWATARLGGTLALAGGLILIRREALWWRAAVMAFIAADLVLFGWPLLPTVDRALYHGETAAAAHLRQEPGPVRVYWPTDPLSPGRETDAEYQVKFSYLTFDSFGPRDAAYWWGMREALVPNVGMLDGVASANNFDPLLVGRYAEVLQAAFEAPALLRSAGVTHVLGNPAWLPGEPAAEPRPLPGALGRAWVVPAARTVPSDETLAALADPAFDPAAEVLLDRPVPATEYPASSIQYQVTLQDAPNRVTIRATLDAPGYLVMADTWVPGWTATVDGTPADVLRANYAFRAVRLEAGDHVVELAYRPWTAAFGFGLSAGSLLCLAAGSLVGWLRKRVG